METPVNPPQLARGQFSLRSVLILVTAAAGLCALGVAIGVRSAMLLGGVFVCLANYLGMLAFIQRRRFAQVALYAAFTAFVISMFLPVVKARYGRGWQLPWRVVDLGYRGLADIGIFYSERIVVRALIPLLCAMLTLANVVMVLCPFFAHRLAAGNAKWLGMLIALAAPGTWGVTFLNEFALPPLQIGFYVWCGAASIGIAVLPMTRGRFIAVLLVASWIIVVHHFMFAH